MKYKLSLLICLTILTLLFTVMGVLAFLGVANAEVSFWTTKAIETKTGKIAWIIISATCFILFSVLSIFEYRRGNFN